MKPTEELARDEVTLAPKGTPLAVFQEERTEAISKMFDNVSPNGIYPTSHFFARLDSCVTALLDRVREEGTEIGAELMLSQMSKAVEKGGMFSDPRANDFVLAVKMRDQARAEERQRCAGIVAEVIGVYEGYEILDRIEEGK